MNHRPYRRRTRDTEPGKNSFYASPDLRSENRQIVKNAIDESLGSVRFNAQDARSVISAARSGHAPQRRKKHRRPFRADLAFAFSLLLFVALPVSLSAIRAKGSITTITAAPGQPTANPVQTFDPIADPAAPSSTAAPTAAPLASPAQEAAGVISESEAIRIARTCFEAHCDTDIFTFEEYEVQTAISEDAPAQYTVTLSCVYKNNCSFSVVIAADSGEVLQYSSPKLATIPAYVNMNAPEVRAWFDKYGEHLFTWPQDVQAEFSRRYQGATLRMAKEGEISYEAALSAVSGPVMDQAPDLFTAFYPVLYSERASASGSAYYVVYCYAEEVTDTLPAGEPMIVSFDAKTGDILSIEGNPLDRPLNLHSSMQAE